MYLNIVVLGAFLLLLAAIYLPPLQVLLRTVPFGFFEWAILISYALTNIVLIEAVKLCFKKE
jgi:uncharacterized membrane protein YqaE (UPF0057 family)